MIWALFLMYLQFYKSSYFKRYVKKKVSFFFPCHLCLELVHHMSLSYEGTVNSLPVTGGRRMWSLRISDQGVDKPAGVFLGGFSLITEVK